VVAEVTNGHNHTALSGPLDCWSWVRTGFGVQGSVSANSKQLLVVSRTSVLQLHVVILETEASSLITFIQKISGKG